MNPRSARRFSIKRVIAKLYIDRSVDLGNSPPAWVSAFCERDVTLGDYERRARLLVEQLRMQADTWAGSQLEICERRAKKKVHSADTLSVLTPSSKRSAAVSSVPSSCEQLVSGTRALRLHVMAALLVLAVGAWFAWRGLGSNERPLERGQQTQSEAVGPIANASKGVDGKRGIVRGDVGDQEQDPNVAWRPVIASVAASEEVFRRVSNGTWHLLSRTLASTTQLGLDVPLARVEEAGEKLRERKVKLRQTMNGMSEAFNRFMAVDGKPE